MPHANIYNIRYPLQHGIRKSRSCETQLIEFIEVSKNLKDGKQTDIFSYALDKVSHSSKNATHNMVYLYDACDQISDFCHQQLLRKMRRKISWMDGRTDGQR
jgi:hypothetical protein